MQTTADSHPGENREHPARVALRAKVEAPAWWSSNPPTFAGFWWAKDPDGNARPLQVVRFGTRCYASRGGRMIPLAPKSGAWAGWRFGSRPIEIPLEPDQLSDRALVAALVDAVANAVENGEEGA